MAKSKAEQLKADAEAAFEIQQAQHGKGELVGYAAVETGEREERALLIVYRPEPVDVEHLAAQGYRQHVTRWAVVIRGERRTEAHPEPEIFEGHVASGLVSVLSERPGGEDVNLPGGEEVFVTHADDTARPEGDDGE